jgi:hypothetical protein
MIVLYAKLCTTCAAHLCWLPRGRLLLCGNRKRQAVHRLSHGPYTYRLYTGCSKLMPLTTSNQPCAAQAGYWQAVHSTSRTTPPALT